jgi:hypothetical protein
MIKFMWLIKKISWKLADSNRQSPRMRCVSHYTELPNKKKVYYLHRQNTSAQPNKNTKLYLPSLGHCSRIGDQATPGRVVNKIV